MITSIAKSWNYRECVQVTHESFRKLNYLTVLPVRITDGLLAMFLNIQKLV